VTLAQDQYVLAKEESSPWLLQEFAQVVNFAKTTRDVIASRETVAPNFW
jgi:hypothetical protein